jgi:molecular chaperone GrpE
VADSDIGTGAGGRDVEAIRAAVRAELDKVVPHVVAALKRDRAFDELTNRLREAERRVEARRERPTGVALLKLLHRLRHLDLDREIRSSLDSEIVGILEMAGFTESGAVGEPFDPDRHEPLDGRLSGGAGTVVEVYATGLASFSDTVVRAQVRVAPRPAAPSSDGSPVRTPGDEPHREN